MIDLSDLTVVIPVRIDSDDRLANLEAVLGFLAGIGRGLHVVLTESASAPRLAGLAARYGAHHVFEESAGPFHRTRLLNQGMIDQTSRAIVASYDADVLVFPAALAAMLSRLRAGASFGWPYGGLFLDVRGARRTSLLQTRDLSGLDPLALARSTETQPVSDVVCLNRASVGGAVFFRRDAFIDAGGYNEAFISWGWEDTELVERFDKLGHAPVRVTDFPLLHLSHRRGPDSSPSNPFFQHNDRTYRRMRALSPAVLRAHVMAGGTRGAAPPEPSRLDLGFSGIRQGVAWFGRKMGLP